jgi:cellulose synthase/poly-beta-1,6-N-acetylglucosamine synthase-like glycosyltransferase
MEAPEVNDSTYPAKCVGETRKVALLAPCYNAARYLPGFAEMVRAQSIPFAEIILYDDGSKDRTKDVAHELGLEIIAGSANRGAGFARNQLLQAVTAPWTHFHDVDDRIWPTFVEKLTPLLGDEKTAATCAIKKDYPDGSEEIIRYPDANISSDWIELFITTIFTLNSFILPTEFLRSIGGFNNALRIGEDREMFVRAALNGLRANYLDETLVGWTVHPNSTMSISPADFIWDQEYNFLHTCYEFLPPKYQTILRDYVLYRAGYALWNGRLSLARRHAQVANRLGFYHESSAGPLSREVSRRLGTLNYLRLKRSWAFVRSLLPVKSGKVGSSA